MNIKAKVWLTLDEKPLIGKGGYLLLKKIYEKGSLRAAAEELGVSYSFAWKYIQRIERVLGERIVITERGGEFRGGSHLTDEGVRLLRLYEKAAKSIEEMIKTLENEGFSF
ncbi:MAG: winged helix-turn-helix domain-containing protein [Infirmifilum sp.]